MKLNESIGRFSVRKTLRFEMKPVARTVDHLDALLADDAERAASLNMVKSAIEAEHLSLVRRVFASLPDPLPDYAAIKAAFRNDPAHDLLSGRNANAVVKRVMERCRGNRWPIPKQIKDLSGWQPLFIKWHWHCYEQYKASGDNPLAREWAGRAKSDVAATCRALRPPKKRRAGRNFWYERAPFRMMFDNRSCGISWLKGDFEFSRTFLLRDGDRVLVGIVPRASGFNPFEAECPAPSDKSYLLYEESLGQAPKLRPIPRSFVDASAHHGFIYLFELTGRAMRNASNMNAILLRALLSDANMESQSLHLDRVCEFYVRNGREIPHDGKPGHFRQRFMERKFSIALHIACNPQLGPGRTGLQPLEALAKTLAANPGAECIKVAPAPGGYMVEKELQPMTVAQSGSMSGLLARMAVERDAYVLFDPSVPENIRRTVEDKFRYIVVRGRDAASDGGALRGYQLMDRLFVGRAEELDALVADCRDNDAQMRARREAEDRLRTAKAVAKAERKARAEERARKIAEDRAARQSMSDAPIEEFAAPPFCNGMFRFKFGYKTSDNTRHYGICRANTRDEVYAKLRTVKIRPFRVECDDPAYSSDAMPEPVMSVEDRLKRLDALRIGGFITFSEHSAQRARIIAAL